MSDIFKGVTVPTAPYFDVEKADFDINTLNDYIKKVTVFHEELLYKMKKVNIVTSDSAGTVTVTGGIVFPTADPAVAGVWWDNAGTLTKSSG